mgnify:CR=1 FL=1
MQKPNMKFFIIIRIFLLIAYLALIINFNGCSPKIECPQCKGEGKITCSNCGGDLVAEHQEDCPTCKNGKVMCQECDGEGSGQCRDCDGAGIKMTICYACGGSGLNNGYYGTCGVCNGSAMTMRPCTKCNGSGNFECDDCNGEGFMRCNECDGKGFMMGSEHCAKCNETGKENCSNCNGEGFIIKK